MKDVITIRGERDLWLDFVHKTRKDKKKVWDILSPYLRKYIFSKPEYPGLTDPVPKGSG